MCDDLISDDHIQKQAAMRKHLMENMTRHPALEVGIGRANNRAVGVSTCPAGRIRALSQTGCSTVVRDGDRYLIIIDEDCDPQLSIQLGPHALRFIAIHEYAHIIHGDVFEDQLRRRTEEERQQAERFAYGYAVDRLWAELVASGHHDLSQALLEATRSLGYLGPTTAEYRERFPTFADEPATWSGE